MDRRQFIRWSSIVAAGLVAADQLEILERLTHVRRLFPSGDLRPYGTMGRIDILDPADARRILQTIPWDGQGLVVGNQFRVHGGPPVRGIIVIPPETKWYRVRTFEPREGLSMPQEIVETMPGPGVVRESAQHRLTTMQLIALERWTSRPGMSAAWMKDTARMLYGR